MLHSATGLDRTEMVSVKWIKGTSRQRIFAVRQSRCCLKSLTVMTLRPVAVCVCMGIGNVTVNENGNMTAIQWNF